MKYETKVKIQAAGLLTIFIILILWSFYYHRNEPHWFDTKYVKVIK